jgi:polar amino acid transport system substrate-binding protein
MQGKTNRLITVGFSVLMAIFGSSAIASASDEARFSIVYDSFARFIYTENGQPQGLYVDIMTEAIESRLGVPVDFIRQPWQRGEFSVENGSEDAMITLATPDRLAYAAASEEPVAESRIGLFTAADHPRFEEMKGITSLEELSDFRILTYLGDGWARQFLSGLDVDFDGKDLDAILKKLMWGRGDVFVQIEDVTRHYIAELEYSDEIVQVPGVRLGEIRFRLLISKASPFVSLLPRIDATLREMRQDGTMDQLKQKYDNP